MKEKILVALSDVVLSEHLTAELKRVGYVSVVAKDGIDVLEKMKSEMPDLAVVDLQLSQKNGYDVLNEKTLDRHITKIPVLVVSNSGTPIEMRRIPSTPSIKDYVIRTHVDPADVIEKINAIFNHPYTSHVHTEPKKQAKKILWVEDDKLLGNILVKKFEISGHIALKAQNGDEALSLLKKEKPDIVVLDILLPGMSGFEVLQKIRMNETTRTIPVIMLSNINKKSDIEKARTLGAQRFLVKAAVSLDQIVQEIEQLTKI